MDFGIIFFAVLLGLIIGFLSALIINKLSKKSNIIKFNEELNNLEKSKFELESKLNTLEEEKSFLKSELTEWKNKYDSKSLDLQDTKEQLVLAKSELKHLEEKLATQNLELEDLQNKFKKEFENLANKIFEEKSEKFTNINKVNLSDILQPFKEKIEKFEKKVEETYNYEARQRASLQGEIKQLVELNNKVSKDAENLTKALKGDSKTQGDWGEVILENILERSGLQKNREYFIQQSFTNQSGRTVRPDVIIKFPEGRNVVVDSKVSLTAYEKYFNSDNKDNKDKYLKEHIYSIKKHIEELYNKDYQNLYSLNSLDFVIMFIPIEPAYLLAINQDSDLWNYAYEKRVLLISPTNLIAILKMVESLWQKEYQNQNALEIARQGADLYDKFVNFVSDLEKIGKNLSDCEKSYQNAMNKLKEGKGNLIRRTENLKKLGISPKKQLPKELLKEID